MKVRLTFNVDTTERCAINAQWADGHIPATRQNIETWIRSTISATLQDLVSEWEVNHGAADERKGLNDEKPVATH